MKYPSVLMVFVLIFQISCHSGKSMVKNSLDILSHYNGEVLWDSNTKTAIFTSSGTINFPEEGVKSFIWHVPKEVKTIIISKNVTVNGGFHTYADIIIEGEDRKTSVVYGTEKQAWPQANGVKAFLISSFEAHKGTMTIQNLTSLNPRSFHVRGLGAVVHLKNADFIDARGGSGNHSDGIAAGDGSSVDNCYFETGDDVIKVYNDITVTNTTINMVKNAVPIQMGWGNYPDGAVGTFKNLTVIGNSGRGSPDGSSNPLVAGRSGTYTVTVNIDGLSFDNPNGSLVNLWDDKNDGVFEKILTGTLSNVNIKNIRRYSSQLNGYDKLKIYDTEGKELFKDKL